MPIDVLPDDVLLVVFDFCEDQDSDLIQLYLPANPTKIKIEAWQSLVHVCRRWRSLVFGSPRRLNLELVCTAKTPSKDTLHAWPALPLRILDTENTTEGLDNIIPVLEHRDRVCQIGLVIPASQWEKVMAAMQEPFPELTRLGLRPDKNNEMATVLPDSFLGGFAPQLRFVLLDGILFPGSPKLLLSATLLNSLLLRNIPHSGCISPEETVTALSTLTSLECFWLEFTSPRPRPDQASRRPPPSTRSVLPVLTSLRFKGASEYLEGLVARIDAPGLLGLDITFFNDIIFDIPQLVQFVRHTPTSKALKKARVIFWVDTARVSFSSPTSSFGVGISCRDSDWQVSSLEQVCTPFLPSLSTLEDLYIYETQSSLQEWKGKIENTLWLDLLHPFTTVKSLYLSKNTAPRIVPALQELVEGRTTAALPTLQNIFLEELEPSGPVQEGIAQFVAARQVTSHQIAVSRWNNSEQDRVPW